MFKRNKVILLLILIFLLYSLRLLIFTFKYSENLPVFDDLDLINYIVNNIANINLFSVVHNDHRIGVGLIVIRFLAKLTSWNTIYMNYVSTFIPFFATISAFRLKFRTIGNITLFDIIIPAILLNLHQYESLIIIGGSGVINLLPLLFLFIFLSIVELSFPIREILVLMLVFLSSYSSFHGLFLDILVLLYFFYHFLKVTKPKLIIINGLLLLLTLFIMRPYFFNFINFQGNLIIPNLIDFIQFSSRMINQVIGYHSALFFIYLLPFILFSALLFFIFLFIRKKSSSFFPILCLYIYSGLYITFATLARITYGFDEAIASRRVS